MRIMPELNSLHYGDNLHIMRTWSNGWVDIAYADPPFNSKANYNQLYRVETDTKSGTPRSASLKAFEDTWTWGAPAVERIERIKNAPAHPAYKAITALHILLGDSGMMAYLSYMAERLVEIHRLLKPTGSLYLHCDNTAGAHLQILLDDIFGPKQFRNAIRWCYSNSGRSKRFFVKKHDTIFLYTKTDAAYWGDYRVPISEKYLESHYRHVDEQGRRCFIRTNAGKTRIYYPADGMTCNDWWIDIPSLNSVAKERLGYPTQKPVALLERIIAASSREGDIVLDPFCGCGTTVVAADTLKRQWVGVDINPIALDIIKTHRFPGRDIPITGIPADFASAARLAQENRRHFEIWAIGCVPGLAPNERGGADGGIDGVGNTVEKPGAGFKPLVLAQVKSGKFSLSHLRDFLHVIEREKAALGIYLTLFPVTSPSAAAEIANKGTVVIGTETLPRVQCYSMSEHFDGQRGRLRMPQLTDPYTGKPLQNLLW